MKHNPKLLIITGRPGAGKTTISKKIGTILRLPVLNRGEFKEGLINSFQTSHNSSPTNTNRLASGAFFDAVELLLFRNISLIAKAAFQHKLWKELIDRVEYISDVLIIVCYVDAMTAAERHLNRGLADPKREYFHGDDSVTFFKKEGRTPKLVEYIPPNFQYETIVVSTKSQYSPSLDYLEKKILAWLAS
ncbi:MAG: hypothetical protein AAFO07_07010 [Bacteroidota bacterium]